MTYLWTAQDVEKALNSKIRQPVADGFSGVSIDSRTVEKGDIFFCIKGDQFDGHDFGLKAFENGASLLVIDKAHEADFAKSAAAIIVVDDALVALEQLGRAARARSQAKIIAITGSVGKTTTKEALRHCLEGQGKVHANPASFNNHWGVPLTLARMPADSNYGIFEIGMNHAGEIRHLVGMVKPDLAIITRIAAVHMGYFKSLEEIADAKAEIFETMSESSIALLNHDDEFFSYLSQKAKKCRVKTIASFGEAKGADYCLLDYRLMPECSCIKMSLKGEEALIKIGAPGRHMVQNALAVIGAGVLLGADPAMMALDLANFSAEKGRGARYRLGLPNGGSFTLIDESYNANPTSMVAVLDLLNNTEVHKRGRRIAVLGDMLELGSFSKDLHRSLKEPVVKAAIDQLYLIGHEMQALQRDVDDELSTVWKADAKALIEPICHDIRDGDVIMIKSSNSIRSSAIVAALLERYKPLAA